MIVANAARDHEKAADRAIFAGVPVLVEKPIAVTAAASQRLAELARGRNVRFAAAHVFLFARYLDHFSRCVADAGTVRSVRVHWMDQKGENRYGEQKQYDPGLPIFADWLPHVLSIVGSFTPSHPAKCEVVKLLRGGSHLELNLLLGDIPCRVQLVRNGDRRQRIVEVEAGQKVLHLDFSKEPGTITDGSRTMVGDPDWDVKQRPAARMLTAFLKWAAGGENDSRLDVRVGLQACQVIDQAREQYHTVLTPWLITKLASPGTVDEDLRYALSEMLQSDGVLSTTTIDRKIDRVREEFSGVDGPRWLRELAGSRDPAALLRASAI